MVPQSLRTWFVIHFAADMLFGIPLLIAPEFVMRLFGWQAVDPFTARLVGAALMGIGGESLLGRNAGAETFRELLNLKLIWAGSAIAGMTATMLRGDQPAAGWLFVGIFGMFFGVWGYYRVRVGEKSFANE